MWTKSALIDKPAVTKRLSTAILTLLRQHQQQNILLSPFLIILERIVIFLYWRGLHGVHYNRLYQRWGK